MFTKNEIRNKIRSTPKRIPSAKCTNSGPVKFQNKLIRSFTVFIVISDHKILCYILSFPQNKYKERLKF